MKSLSLLQRSRKLLLIAALLVGSLAALPASADEGSEASGMGSAVDESGPSLGQVTGTHTETTDEGYPVVVTEFENGRRYDIAIPQVPDLSLMSCTYSVTMYAPFATYISNPPRINGQGDFYLSSGCLSSNTAVVGLEREISCCGYRDKGHYSASISPGQTLRVTKWIDMACGKYRTYGYFGFRTDSSPTSSSTTWAC